EPAHSSMVLSSSVTPRRMSIVTTRPRRFGRLPRYASSSARQRLRTSGATLAKPYPGKSTMRRPGVSSKKFTSCVRPGVLLTRASLRAPVTTLIALDFPEFERPTNATSGASGRGKPLGSEALVRNFAGGMSGCGRNDEARVVYNPRLTPDERIQGLSQSVDEMIDQPRGRRMRPSTVLAAVAIFTAAVLTGTAFAQEEAAQP